MAGTAVVTGSTRGPGKAVAQALRRDAGIAVYRWNVADFAACRFGRLGTPTVFVRVVAFLADDAADLVAGATSGVNGSQYLA